MRGRERAVERGRGRAVVRNRAVERHRALVRDRAVARECAGPGLGVVGGQRCGVVAVEGAGGDAAVGPAFAGALEVAAGFEFAQAGGDQPFTFAALGGEGLDADVRASGEGLDAHGEPDGGEAEFGVLGEVVADDGEAVGVREGDVDDAPGGERPRNLRKGAGEGSILLGIHREAPDFLGGQALDRDSESRPGADVWGHVVWREHMPDNGPQSELS